MSSRVPPNPGLVSTPLETNEAPAASKVKPASPRDLDHLLGQIPASAAANYGRAYDGPRPGARLRSGWHLEGQPPPIDVTARLKDLLESVRDTRLDGDRWRLPEPAYGMSFLVVGGLFVERDSAYMKPTIEGLSEAGLHHVTRARTDSRQSVADNARVVADHIRRNAAQGRKTFLVSHSQGTLPVERALIDRELWPHIGGWIPMNSGVGGSSLANAARDDGMTKLAQLGFRAVDVDPSFLTDVTYEARRRYLGEHGLPQVKTLSLLTHTRNVVTLFGAMNLFSKLRFGGEPTDGFLLVKDGLWPGAANAVLEGPDHIQTVRRSLLGQDPDPADLIQALVSHFFEL